LLTNSSELTRRLRVPGYMVAALLFVLTFFELAVATWPYRPHDISWRLGVAGGISGGAGTALIAIFFAFAIALAAGDRPVLWLVSAISGLAAALFLIGCAFFVLDALQMKGQVKPELMSRYNLSFAWGFAKIVLDIVVFAGVAYSGIKSAGALSRSVRAAKSPSLLVPASRPASRTPARSETEVRSR
jgi:hypothetical protein